MAEFCNQCAKMLGLPEGDFGYTRVIDGVETVLTEGYFWSELCEHCGPCQVTDSGDCVSPNCLEHHGVNEVKHE